jgi:tetratricopeptide (TPR) repeat protein
MARRKAATPAEAFNVTLRVALEHYADPLWLGTHSALATPYFLGAHLKAETSAANDRGRGQILQILIKDTTAELWSGPLPTSRNDLIKAVSEERQRLGYNGPRYYFLLLELRYLRHYFPPNAHPVTVAAIPDFVTVSSTRFFVHLEQAIVELGKLLLQRTQPTLRLERPGVPPELVGREAILSAIIADLPGKRSLSISGVGGIGKTSLGATIMAAWPTEAVLWFTFHPGLNDDLNSVLFSIGHFLNQWGRSSLWLQLLANQGKLENVEYALGFLRQDLEALVSVSPLFCFDEVDSLLTSGEAPRRKNHIQLLEFLESLRGLVALLLLGQRALLDTDAHYALQPLSLSETEILLKNAGIQLESHYLHRLHRFAHGNPRLLVLYIALHQSGDDVTEVVQLSHAPAARPLFNRLWKRLDQRERYILGVLSAFRTPAPRDAWQTDPLPLESLIRRKLVMVDLAGGITLLPFFRELVWQELLPEQREQFHDEAATIRLQRGEYTAAAYHYGQAMEYEAAVQVWYSHQEQEIRRGQAGAAYEVFQYISADLLKGQPQKELKIIQNRLYLLAGEAERVLEGMEEFSWHPDEEITADAYRQWAEASAILGQTDKALERYGQAIDTLIHLSNKIGETFFRRGQMFIRQADLAAARREAQSVQYEVDTLQGLIEHVTGNFDLAHSHYHAALQLAHSYGDERRIARSHYSLAMIAGRQGRLDVARQHAEEVMVYYEKIGNRLQLEGMRAELAGMYLNVREFEAVIEPAEKALHFFEQIKHDRWISAICNNLAEAYFETGQIEKAKAYVHRVLQLEYPRSRPNALYTMGLVHQHEQDFTRAEASFQEGIQVAQQNSDRFLEAYLQRALGKLYLHLQEYDKGKVSLEMAMRLFEHMGLDREALETSKLL